MKINQSWEQSEKYWPFVITITNIICIILLIKLFQKEGKNYFDIFKIKRENLKKDLKKMILILLMIFPIAFLPNIIISNLLFGDIQIAVDLLVRPMPYSVAVLALILFPITQGLVEIPLYFSYVMPGLEKQGYKNSVSLGLPALMLGLQHIAVPFIFNYKYLIWRGLMFLPFAFLIGIVF